MEKTPMKSSSEPTNESLPNSAPESIDWPAFLPSVVKELKDYHAALANLKAPRRQESQIPKGEEDQTTPRAEEKSETQDATETHPGL
jgi:hypothetical protein